MGARYDCLPVYREAYDLIVYFNNLSVNLARDMRYTIAEDLKRSLIAVEVDVYRANAAKAGEKLQHITDAQDRMVEVCLYLRLLHDCQQITIKQYAICSEKAVAIETHLSQWHRYYAEECRTKGGEDGAKGEIFDSQGKQQDEKAMQA